MASSTSTWPPSNGLTTNLVSREATILPTYASIHISAPASIVWSILINTTTYPAWCTFVPKATIRAQPDSVDPHDSNLHLDTHFTFHVIMNSKKPTSFTDTDLRVTDISTPEDPSEYIAQSTLDSEPAFFSDLNKLYRISWSTEGGFVAKGLKTERFHELIILSEEECEVRTWECQGGTLARMVKWMYQDVLRQKFQDWVENLKEEAEKQHEKFRKDYT